MLLTGPRNSTHLYGYGATGHHHDRYPLVVISLGHGGGSEEGLTEDTVKTEVKGTMNPSRHLS